MTSFSSNEKINILKSLFKGRDDVFAIRWEKNNKSGYMPVVPYDPYLYRRQKMAGSQSKPNTPQTYIPLSDQQIEKHLSGMQQIGIYPLLKDNTSWFIAADFDKTSWVEDCRNFLNICKRYDIPAYLERSRSGKGGHVWIFFDHPCDAIISRKVVLNLLEQSGAVSVFDKNSSFDRLFPNQDRLSGKGFGNLIALPLNHKSFELGNNCFINPGDLNLISDQWLFLNSVKRASKERFASLYHTLHRSANNVEEAFSGKLTITFNNNIQIHRSSLPISLINYLKEELNFTNTAYIIKKKIGKSTFGTTGYFKFIEENENWIIIPKGFARKLILFCVNNRIEYELIDNRKKLEIVPFTFNATLRSYQNPVVEATLKKDMGVIVAPPGAGKTVIGLRIIAEKQQPALIVVHRKHLAEQWAERIEAFLGIAKHEIGKIGQGKIKVGKKISIATIQSLATVLENPEYQSIVNTFGTIIVDECHHVPAETFHNTIGKLYSYYLYGLTATPFRKYNDGKLIFIHLGEIISEIKSSETGNSKQPQIIIRNTTLDIPFNEKIDKFEVLSKMLVHDSTRNRLILGDINIELASGKKVVILTERKEHIETLHQFLKQSYEVITLHGEDSENIRKAKWKVLDAGNYQALITTGQFFGEGSDLHNAQCLFLVYPFSFEGKLIQYIGRVQRSEVTPSIYDYRDIKIPYLNKLFLKRNVYYRKLEKQRGLFDDITDEPEKLAPKVLIIDKTIKVAIEELEFVYGGITFNYKDPETSIVITFEIENSYVRPEFAALKPYFAKFLGHKSITAKIYVEIENNAIEAQSAISEDITKLDRDIIESVRFRFLEKTFLGKSTAPLGNTNLLNLVELQNGSGNLVYETEDELLQDILKETKYRHYHQIRYLSEQHQNTVLKIRFVLSPFAFVFLLAGIEQFHIVMETLDTAEATYIWHVSKDIASLKIAVKEIDNHLQQIRNEGRQTFLQKTPSNFSRILHDYTDTKKGFIIWKDLITERLV